MGDGDTVLNAVVGAVVTTVLSGVFPLAAVVGGGVAGYLQGTDPNDGVRVGLVSGAIAAIPAVAVFALVFSVVAGVLFSVGEFGIPFAFGGLFAVVLLFAVAITVALSAVGGWLGSYLRAEL